MVQNLRSRLIQPTASSSRGLSWPRSFGLGLTKPRLTVDEKVFVEIDSNVVRGLLKPWTIGAHALFSIISKTFTAERRALQWKTTRLIGDKLFAEVSAQVSQQPSTNLDRNLHLKRKRQCNIWRFSWPKPIVSLFCSLEPLLQITRGTTSSLVRSGREELSREPFIGEVRVLWTLYSYKWFPSRVM